MHDKVALYLKGSIPIFDIIEWYQNFFEVEFNSKTRYITLKNQENETVEIYVDYGKFTSGTLWHTINPEDINKDYTGLYFLNEDFNWDSGDVLNSILYKYGGYASYEYRDDWYDDEYKIGMNDYPIGRSGMSIERPFDKYKKMIRN